MLPSPFDAFMRRLAQATDLRSQSQLAAALGLTRSAVSRAKQRGAVPEGWITRLCNRYGLDPDWLRHGREALERFLEIPLVEARLDAGGGSHMVEAEVRGHIAFRRDWLGRKGRPESMVLMEVIGDSMEPVIRQGDSVLIDQSRQEVHSGAIYALGIAETIMVKRLERQPSKLVLLSANPDYAPIVLQGDEIDTIRIIGTIVGMWRDFR